MTRPAKKAMNQVESAAYFYRQLGEQIKKWGLRITVVKMVPPTIDVRIKTSAD